MEIAVIGSCMVDLIAYTDTIPKAGETLVAKEFVMGCGGKGANQAVAASRLGAPVLMMGRVGDDAFADNTLANFRSYGVSTEYVTKVPGVSSGVAPIWVDADSQNRILIIPGANMHLMPADIEAAAERLAGCGMIILQLEIPLETVYAAIDFGNRHNIPVLLNPAPASTELDIDYACRCDFFVPNETELEILTGMPVGSIDEITAAAHSLLDRGLRNLIVTLGDKGALWLHGDEREHISAPSVNAVDTTGAGDAFIGCFAARVAAGAEVSAAIAEAIQYASHSVTGKGTQTSYATAEEFAAWKP
ncbi:MAG: ribokinase [Halieaceae bacterium]|jgi:ribokinase|nr:ribokinase [Halieaceae bacterium]